MGNIDKRFGRKNIYLVSGFLLMLLSNAFAAYVVYWKQMTPGFATSLVLAALAGVFLIVGSTYGNIRHLFLVVTTCILNLLYFHWIMSDLLKRMDVWGLDPLLMLVFYLWAIVLIASVLAYTVRFAMLKRHRKRSMEPTCRRCGYLLKGLALPRCPECGTNFDPRLLGADEWKA